jgi:hypothetical protein
VQERAAKTATTQASAQREYIESVAGGGATSTTDQLATFADLYASGTLTDAEFKAQKDKPLS